MISKEQLIEQREQLERDKTALMASQVVADLNAINGGLQTIAYLLDQFEEVPEE